MPRVIKFRAWDTNANQMVTEPFCLTHNGISFVWRKHKDSYGDATVECVDPFDMPFIIQQFTGLLDKNGKEIYEGDIVKLPYRKKFVLGEVAWGTCGFWIKGWLDKLNRQYAYPCEVIGNIYENPELLKS